MSKAQELLETLSGYKSMKPYEGTWTNGVRKSVNTLAKINGKRIFIESIVVSDDGLSILGTDVALDIELSRVDAEKLAVRLESGDNISLDRSNIRVNDLDI